MYFRNISLVFTCLCKLYFQFKRVIPALLVGNYQKVGHQSPPHPISYEPIDFSVAWDDAGDDFTETVDKAFCHWSERIEPAVDTALTFQNQGDPQIHPQTSLPVSYKGRCGCNVPKTQKLCTPIRSDRHGAIVPLLKFSP